jgi:hypothetical protein
VTSELGVPRTPAFACDSDPFQYTMQGREARFTGGDDGGDRSGVGDSPNSAVHHCLGQLEDDMWGVAVGSGAKGDLVH